MSSWGVRPVWLSRMIWSTLVASNSRSFRRMVSGEPISPTRSVSCGLRRVAPLLVELPHVALPRRGHPVASVVGKAEHEERPSRRLGLRLLVGGRAHERGDHGDVRVGRVVGELGGALDQVAVVLVDPGARGFRRHELKAERPHPPLPRAADRRDVGAGHPERRVRLLVRLGDDVARGKVEELAVELDGLLGEARHQRPHRLLPHVALVAHPPAERMQLDRPLPLAEAELHAAPAEQIERGHPLGHADRVVRGELDDAVAEPDPLGPLGRRAQEHLGRR